MHRGSEEDEGSADAREDDERGEEGEPNAGPGQGVGDGGGGRWPGHGSVHSDGDGVDGGELHEHHRRDGRGGEEQAGSPGEPPPFSWV